jgi:hypothetical protein
MRKHFQGFAVNGAQHVFAQDFADGAGQAQGRAPPNKQGQV